MEKYNKKRISEGVGNPRQRHRSNRNRSHGRWISLNNIIFVTVIGLWSYWILYCQPLDNIYEISTTTSTTTSITRTTKTKSSGASSTKMAKEPLAPQIGAIKVSETIESAINATVIPSSTGTEAPIGEEEEEGEEKQEGKEKDAYDLGDDEIGVDEEPEQADQESESEGGDDDNASATVSEEEEQIDGDTNDEEEEEDQADGDTNEGEEEGQADDDRPPKDGSNEPVKISIKNYTPPDERFKNHLYMFVHLGKAGGTTLSANIRTLCMRKNIEMNILWQRRAKKPKVGRVKCLRSLQNQADPSQYNPPTEMVLSNGRVVGYMHMNFLTYWWNANDDGEAIDQKMKKHNIQDYISGIVASGNGNSLNISTYRDPPIYGEKDDGMTKSTAFLIPVRDPIDRLVSAFNYHHPHNLDNPKVCNRMGVDRFSNWITKAFYCHCFDTVNELVNIFKEDDGPPKYVQKFNEPGGKISCRKIAERVLMGKSLYKPNSDDEINRDEDKPKLKHYQEFDLELIRKKKIVYAIGHITMNYGYYYRRNFLKYPEKDIVAIRTEHMWEDLQNLEYKLGGVAPVLGEASGHKSVTHGSSKFVASEKITDPDAFQVICCAISSEVKIYIELIERAINLTDEQKKETLTAFAKRCNLDLCVS